MSRRQQYGPNYGHLATEREFGELAFTLHLQHEVIDKAHAQEEASKLRAAGHMARVVPWSGGSHWAVYKRDTTGKGERVR